MDQEYFPKIFHTNPPYKMYVEQLGDKNSGNPSVVFIHGGYHTGFCYVQTPDGRPGWAPLIAQKGFNAYVTDVPDMGRSGSIPFEDVSGNFIVEAYVDFIKKLQKNVILITHSMSGAFGYRIGELLPEQIESIISIEPVLPGNLQDVIKPYFEAEGIIKAKLKQIEWIFDMNKYSYPPEQLIKSFLAGENSLFPNDKHSLAQYESSLQKIHPRLAYERLNINNSQVRIDDFSKLKNIRCLVVTSSNNNVHIIDDKKIPETFRPFGIQVDHFMLGEMGIQGNNHMMMLEKNNEQILDLIIDWIKK